MEYSEEFLRECDEEKIKIALDKNISKYERCRALYYGFSFSKSIEGIDFWISARGCIFDNGKLPYKTSIALHDILEALEERKVR